MRVAVACRVLGVSRSGFYGWRQRRGCPGPRHRANEQLLAQIRAVHADFPSYGSPRVHQELRRREHCAGRNRVARLMRNAGLQARRGRTRYRPRSAPPRRRPEIVDLVRRDFGTEGPNKLWCIDITQIRTQRGWLFAAVMIDAFSRKVISWATNDRHTNELPIEALAMATAARQPTPGGIVHSDRGYQFTSRAWLSTVEHAGMHPSMGNVGSALDNALIESWFSSFKNEAIYPNDTPPDRTSARRALVRHIDFHNRQRLHSAIGYNTPNDHENNHINMSA